MPKRKRTADELRVEILEKIKEMEDNTGENDINKTAIANAVGLNNTLATSLLDGMEKERMVRRDGCGYYAISRGGEGLLEITRIGWEKTGEILKIAHKIARNEPLIDKRVIRETKETTNKMCVFCGMMIGEMGEDIRNRHSSECEWIKLRELIY